MYPDFFDSAKLVAQYDPEVADAMDLELGRQRRNIELIPPLWRQWAAC